MFQNNQKLLNLSFSSLGLSITDGALRMLLVLYFHGLGFDPISIASIFILYEVAGIFTNFLGGWIGNLLGLKFTLVLGLFLQVGSLFALGLNENNLTVIFVMLIQGFLGISKDLVKMSAKSAVKVLNQDAKADDLYKWVSLLTGYKNTFKGLGYLLGGVLLTAFGFKASVYSMGLFMGALSIFSILSLPSKMGKGKSKQKFSSLFSKSREINFLSLSRFFLFGARDIWFVIALPLFLRESLNWSQSEVGLFTAGWIVAYGLAQTLVPKFLDKKAISFGLGEYTVAISTGLLVIFPLFVATSILTRFHIQTILIIVLICYGVFFAINSIGHSFLILALSEDEKVSTDVGFYYTANSFGRLVGTILSGVLYQSYGFVSSLLISAMFLLLASFTASYIGLKKEALAN